MKLVATGREVSRINTNPEKQFTIKATGKAFRVLSSGLYKDKIRAVVREISCNAYDAHLMAGKSDIPFEVHLPTGVEPWFEVRDFGSALSPDQIENVFTKYFESTKSEDDTQIGGFGLGCKTPFSYVDSFTVVSNYEGTRYNYSVFFNDDDVPSIVLLNEEKTNDPSGLAVSMAVQPEHFHSFRINAQDIFEYFPVHPIITGNSDYVAEKSDVVLKGDGFRICDGSGGGRAIMGVVSYPIDNYQLGNFKKIYEKLEIDFPIGFLDITASREELSYIPETVQRLKDRISEIINEIPALVIDSFKQCRTEFEARRLHRKLFGFSIISEMFPGNKVPFRGKIISSSYFSLAQEDMKEISLINYISSYKNKTIVYTSTHKNVRLPTEDETRVFVDDINGRSLHARINLFKDKNRSPDIWVVKSLDVEKSKQLLNKLDGLTYQLASDLERPAAKERPKTSVLSLDSYNRTYGSCFRRDSWKKTVVDPSEGGIYIPTNSGIIDYFGRNMSNSEFQNFYSSVLSLGLFEAKTTPLYSIPKSIMKNFSEEDGWINFFTHVRDAFLTNWNAENWAVDLGKSNAIADFRESFPDVVACKQFVLKIGNLLEAGHPLRAFCDHWNECGKHKDYATHVKLANYFGLTIVPDKIYDLRDYWSKYCSQYEMMEYILREIKRNYSPPSDSVIQKTVNYIRMVDLAKKQLTS